MKLLARNKLITRIKEFMQKPIEISKNVGLRRVLIMMLLFAGIYALLAVMITPARIDVELGKPSPKTVYADRDINDDYETGLLREKAAAEVSEVIEHNARVLEETLNEIDDFFNLVFELKNDDEKEPEEKVEELQRKLRGEVSEEDLAVFLATDRTTLRDLQGRLKELLSKNMEKPGIMDGAEEAARSQIMQEIGTFIFNIELKKVSEKLVAPLIRPTTTKNEEATEKNREEAKSEVNPVTIMQGALIISEGEMVTEAHFVRLEALGLIRGGESEYVYLNYLGLFLLILVLFVTVGIYLNIYYKDVYNSSSLLVLLGFIVLLTLVLALGATYFNRYLIPVAAGIILITILFGHRLAILMNIILTILVGITSSGELSVIMMSLTGGLVAILTVSRLSRRTDLVKAGIYVALVNMVMIITVYLLTGGVRLEVDFLREFGINILAGMGNGISSAIIAIGLLPFLESGFGLTTSVTLLEMSNPNNPLLRQLLMKSPGTYYHSMIVGNLAEAAAEDLEAEPLLARVGAYYHDIGKARRPFFFIENQHGADNPHDKLSPNLSALVISAHVKDGLEMAKKEKIPVVIQDIIAQHHGTSLISFFYHEAKERMPGTCEEDFRYEGPRPQTREAAIIMLADAVEAGVRSLKNPDRDSVEQMVRSIIKNKLNDGQLDECDLTLRNLEMIGNNFIHVLSNVYHNRIEYPEKYLRESELKKKALNVIK